MPGKGLISSLTEKAQAAVAGLSGTHKDDGSPAPAGSSAGGSGQYQAPPDKEQSGTLSGRHYGLETIQHHLRTLQVQYSSGVSQENRQLQLLITATKGVALDIDAAGRDAKSQSKELFLWGQTQDADIKDVTDRLAYLNFVQGALSYTLATDIDKSRVVWKNVRDAEAALAPRRLQRSNISTQINKFKTEGGKAGGIDQRLADLEAQLKKAEADDAPLEHELELLKRTAIKESETLKWKALSEYAHKLLLLAGASEQLLKVLPSSRLAEGEYKGHQQTAAVRAALQNALDSGYIPEPAHLPLNVGQPAGETRSFGETHASELSTIQTVTDNGHEAPHGAGGADRRASQDTARPIDPTALNNAPAHIPAPSRSNVPPTGTAHYKEPSLPPSGHFAAPSTAPPSAFHDSPTHKYAPPATGPPSGAADLAAASTAAVAGSHTSVHSTGVTGSSTSVPHGPTVAETGVPVSAGAEGPGPAAGNLHDIAHQHPTDSSSLPGYGGSGNAANAPGYTATGATGGVGYSSFASAEEEKRRLRAAQEGEPTAAHPPGGLDVHQGGLVASTSTRRPNTHQPATTEHESAEDEKKRLEREERERVLRGDGNAGAGSNLPHREPTQDDGAEGPAPPAYQD